MMLGLMVAGPAMGPWVLADEIDSPNPYTVPVVAFRVPMLLVTVTGFAMS